MKFRGEEYAVRQIDGEVVVRDWPSRQTLSNPLWWVAWTWQFSWRWLVTRPYMPMLLSLPAAAVMAFGVVAVMGGSQVGSGNEALTYKRILGESMRNEDYERADISSRALLEMDADSDEYLFNRAIVLEKTDRIDEAKAIMVNLANEQKHARAALWLANAIGPLKDFGKWTPAQRKEFLDWLDKAAENDPKNTEPRKLRGHILRLAGDARGAYEELAPLAADDRQISYWVTFLEKQLGMEEQSTRRAEQLIRQFREEIENDSTDLQSRLQAASMMALLGREDEAIKYLREGLLTTSDPGPLKQLKSALVESMVLKARKILENDPSPRDLMQGLQLLKDGMSIDPNNRNLLEVVGEACVRAAQSENNELFVLREALVQAVEGVDPDTSHFILGTVALNEGNVDDAAHHLEIAARNNPNLPGLLNNLAVAISESQNPDYERALRLSEAAVRQMPGHPYIRETRGQILLKLERYTDAIADLEFALKAEELRPPIREGLAIAYAALGQDDIAQRQRELKAQGK